jgi:hypothetical protein
MQKTPTELALGCALPSASDGQNAMNGRFIPTIFSTS